MAICTKKKFIRWAKCITTKKIKRSKGTKDLLCEGFFMPINSLVPIPKNPQISLQKSFILCYIIKADTIYS